MVNTEVIVEGNRLDVQSGLDFSFNYQVSDIRNPETRSTEFSKTIRCPGTANNNTLFGHIFDVMVSNPTTTTTPNIAVNFNPNKKAAVSVLVDTLPVFDGVIQLRRIIIEGEKINYEVVMIGRLSNIFTRIADSKINGQYITNEQDVVAGAIPIYAPYIDCSDLNQEWTRPNIVTTWTAPIGEGIVYPMLDYGTNTLYYSDGRRVYHVEDFRPAIYVKELIDRIFAYAGSTYVSAFLNSTGFKRLIVPLTEAPDQSDQETANHYLLVQKDVDQGLHKHKLLSTGSPFAYGDHDCFINLGPGLGYTKAKVCYDVEVVDPVNQWVISDTPNQVAQGGNFSPAQSQYEYQIYQVHRVDSYTATVNLRIWYNSNLNGMVAPNGIYLQRLQIIHFRAADGSVTVVAEQEFQFDMLTLFGFSSVGTGPFPSVSQTVTCSVQDLDTYAGDAVFVVIDANGPDGFAQGYENPANLSNTISYVGYFIEGGSFECVPNNSTLYEGGIYDITEHLPDVSMQDFLVSVLRMFNLQMTPSPDVADQYIIETWAEYYANGTGRDWTYKIDHNSPIELIPMGLLAAREYLFSYTEDADYYNDRYQSNHGRTYGSRRFEVDNDFVPKRTEVTIVFSPTPLVNDYGSNRIIGKIYDADISEGAQPTDANIRILYFAGLLPSNPSWRFRSGYPPAVNLDITVSDYPYAGHLNHPITPTFDLSWGIPFELYYALNAYITQLFYTNSNLFNEYHLRQYREIIDKDSKLMVAYFHLKPIDVLKLDFRDIIQIDGVYWRLNRVLDYNPFKDGLTKCELIKVLDLDPFKKVEFDTAVKRRVGDVGLEIEQSATVKDTLRLNGRNVAPMFQGVVKGASNNIDGTATAFVVTGDFNTIGAGSSAIQINGSNNTVDAGLHNITLLNTFGYHATKSNTTVVDGGEVVLFGGIVEGGADEVRAMSASTPITIIDGGEDTVTNIFAEYHNDLN